MKSIVFNFIFLSLCAQCLKQENDSVIRKSDWAPMFSNYSTGLVSNSLTASSCASISDYVNYPVLETKTAIDSDLLHATGASEFTSSLLSSLWSGIEVKTDSNTKISEPTELPEKELVPPPNLHIVPNSGLLPSNFLWGWAGSAPQIEGAVIADNRGPSIWDNVIHKVEGFVASNETLDITNNNYYFYKQDIHRLKKFGVPAYSFSISWSRIFPFGNGTVNEPGLKHYVDLVEYLVANNIVPIVTLYHWDIPQSLQNWYGGWLNRKIIDDFTTYARVLFHALSPKVKFWITVNEPQIVCTDYELWPLTVPEHVFPVHRINYSIARKYICGHHILLAHANAVKIFRQEIIPKYGQGKIGFANSWDYTPPLTNSSDDITASKRSLDFTAGWFSEPVYLTGDYPDSMRSSLGGILPEFSDSEKQSILGSADFYAWDSYTGHPIKAPSEGIQACINDKSNPSWPMCAEDVFRLDGDWVVGDTADPGVSEWLYSTPDLFRDGIRWSWKKYPANEYIIPEFGFSQWKESEMDEGQARNDENRVSYFRDYLDRILDLVNKDGINITTAIAWSLYDNFEWRQGTKSRFGLQRFDYDTGEIKFKKSAFYMREFFHRYIKS